MESCKVLLETSMKKSQFTVIFGQKTLSAVLTLTSLCERTFRAKKKILKMLEIFQNLSKNEVYVFGTNFYVSKGTVWWLVSGTVLILKCFSCKNSLKKLMLPKEKTACTDVDFGRTVFITKFHSLFRKLDKHFKLVSSHLLFSFSEKHFERKIESFEHFTKLWKL